jgi:Ca2+-binding EF-hand superfamily protein
MEYGCKVFKLYTFRDFDKDGTITKEKLENIVKRQQKTIQKAKRIMKNGNSLIYIGFPHVPLGFLDGVNFSDIDDPILYEYQGMDSECLGKGFFELKRIYNTEIEIEQTLNNYDSLDKEVVLKIEQSFKINDDDIKKVVNVSSIVSLSSSKIGRWKITNYAQIDKYQREFEKMLTEMKAKGVEKIHLFATTPVSLSFSLGRVINHYHPEIIVYNYNNGTFDWGINLQNREIIEPVSQ